MVYTETMTLLKRSFPLLKSRICFATSFSHASSSKNHHRQRTAYSYFLPMQTRWHDNDQYGHVNNAIYYNLFDTVINHYLIRYCNLDTNLQTSSMVGYIVANQCSFHAPLTFPQNPLAALAIEKIGRSSVHYRLALFLPLADQEQVGLNYNVLNDGCFSDSPLVSQFEAVACTTGSSTHVFVDCTTNKPRNLPTDFVRLLERIVHQKDPLL